MKYDVTFTEQAENDLRGIFEHIAFDLISPENAAGQLDRSKKNPCYNHKFYEAYETFGFIRLFFFTIRLK